MNETENKAFGCPVDNDVSSQKIGEFVGGWRQRTIVSEFTANTAKPSKTNASDTTVKGFALQHAVEISLRGGAFVGMYKLQKRLPYELGGLFLKMMLKDRIEIDELEIGGKQCPITAVLANVWSLKRRKRRLGLSGRKS
eukprot:GHVO01026549.1.p2 GENE.GHVO01026549.1~~GHVO01026549.1.p2  ORF type:complete len:139 (+),score=21.35 GHVO01026549.1:268-684(+)